VWPVAIFKIYANRKHGCPSFGVFLGFLFSPFLKYTQCVIQRQTSLHLGRLTHQHVGGRKNPLEKISQHGLQTKCRTKCKTQCLPLVFLCIRGLTSRQYMTLGYQVLKVCELTHNTTLFRSRNRISMHQPAINTRKYTTNLSVLFGRKWMRRYVGWYGSLVDRCGSSERAGEKHRATQYTQSTEQCV